MKTPAALLAAAIAITTPESAEADNQPGPLTAESPIWPPLASVEITATLDSVNSDVCGQIPEIAAPPEVCSESCELGELINEIDTLRAAASSLKGEKGDENILLKLLQRYCQLYPHLDLNFAPILRGLGMSLQELFDEVWNLIPQIDVHRVHELNKYYSLNDFVEA